MLRSLTSIEGYKLSASDGEFGRVIDFLLDDETWAVRYLVAQPKSFLADRKVLIAPVFFRRSEWPDRHFHLALTKDKVEHSPRIDVDKPVSRQHERNYYSYFGYPYYPEQPGFRGFGGSPGLGAADSVNAIPEGHQEARPADTHLRSANELRGYHIQGNDKEIGNVTDFFVEEETWQVRYLAIETGSWLFGRKVLIAPQRAEQVNWAARKVFLDLSSQQIEDSPAWNGTDVINREYESRLHKHYGHPAYWENTHPPAPVGRGS